LTADVAIRWARSHHQTSEPRRDRWVAKDEGELDEQLDDARLVAGDLGIRLSERQAGGQSRALHDAQLDAQ
jgi:hypothetical protein